LSKINFFIFQYEMKALVSPSEAGKPQAVALVSHLTDGEKEPVTGLMPLTPVEKGEMAALVSPPQVGTAEPVALVSPRGSIIEEFPPDKNAEEADLVGGAGDATPPSRPSSTPLRYIEQG
jgi:hypothetical protein